MDAGALVMLVAIRQLGNSLGVVIPQPMLRQAGLSRETGADLVIDGSTITIRRPKDVPRTGWAEAAQQLAAAGDDRLVVGQRQNAGEEVIAW